MSDPDRPPTADQLIALLEEPDRAGAAARLDSLGSADTDTRKRVLRAVRNAVEESASALRESSLSLDGLTDSLTVFLTDEDRAVRLTTAKLFVTVAESDPETARPAVDTLAERVADAEEFHYVRARCAEALGYVAVASPEAVADPATLADFQIGLSFEEPEVREKLAKALAYVALGDPSRLSHRAESLADHLDDDRELVRYHLCTALVVVGCEHPTELTDAEERLRERLADESPYVRGRAAEALGLLAETGAELDTTPELDASRGETAENSDAPSFLIERLRFLRARLSDEPSVSAAESSGPPNTDIGTVGSVRDGTDDVVAEMTAPDGAECPHCGLELPENPPPMCPQCGSPR